MMNITLGRLSLATTASILTVRVVNSRKSAQAEQLAARIQSIEDSLSDIENALTDTRLHLESLDRLTDAWMESSSNTFCGFTQRLQAIEKAAS